MNVFYRKPVRHALAAALVGLYVVASAAQEPEPTHALPFIPSASDALSRQGFVRIINHSDESGEVRIEAIDDEGASYGPVMLDIGAGEAVHFNSDDLENGNAEKGLSDGVGAGEGDWRLALSSGLDIEVLSYVRTSDGFLTSMHDTVPSEDGTHRVVFFNPGSNESQVSRLRLVNSGEVAAEVSIAGVDDRGTSPGGEVTATIPAGASRTFTAAALESGGEGLEGGLGDGAGKWRLTVQSEQPLVAMSLLSDPMGYLTNLSTVPGNGAGSIGAVQFLPSASDALGRQGFVRIINHSDESGEVRIEAIDDEGASYGPVMLDIGAGEAVHFNSDDLENGNAEKGLSDGVGAGEGDWRLALSSGLDIEVLSYVRTSDGFLTAMHDAVPSAGGRHWVAFFNPGDNESQVSRLRLVNPGEAEAEVSIAGVDDRGESPGSEVTVTIPAGASRTFTAAELESGGEGLGGGLGDGEGKWRLTVESMQPLVAMTLLSDPMGYLTNLSTAPGREPNGPPDLVVVSPTVSNNRPVAGATFTLSATVRNDGGAPSTVTVLRFYRSSDATVTKTDRAVGTDAVAGMAASGSASVSVELSAPSTAGTYYYGACVDAVAEELDTTNNCSVAIEVDVQESESESRGRPDLTVVPPTVNDDAPVAGGAFILSVTVENAGDGTAPSATMRYYQSSDSTITTSDTPAGTDEVAELGASGSGSKSVELTAPSAPGTYYYGACVDAVTDESDTANNCSSAVKVSVPEAEAQSGAHPDLSIPALLAATSPGGTYTGDAFTVSATVSNTGDGDAAATTLRYYRSTDATITTSDTEVGTDAVAGLAASASGSESVELTAPSTPGTYYYGACVDAVADESDTTNNCSASRQIEVLDPTRPPDLVVVSPSVSDDGPVAGETFTVSATVRNDGDGDAAATTLRYYRSADATITTADTEVGTDAVAGLAAAASSDESAEVTAPSTAGPYYYGVCVDEVAEESDTANNCSASVKVDVEEPPKYPDLEVGAPTVDEASPETGATFTLSATVTNSGGAEVAATTLRYYRSTDATITTSDTAVGTDVVEALAASGTSEESIELTAPSTAGAVYYGACVDAVTDESDTTDNCSASVKVDVEEPTAPDLEVGTPTVNDASPETGATFTLSATVTNAGDEESVATTLRYYRSTDATITTSDTAVGTDAVEALSASGTSAESIELTAPSTAGAVYYGACVDAVTDESDTTDNCSASVKVDVEEPAAPDLEVGTPTVDDTSPETGATFTLSATVTNAGDEESVATRLRYYRSTDATITTSDTAVGTDAVEALSASGTSAESIELTAPSTAGTVYYGACVDAVTDESDTTDNCSASVKVDVEAQSSGTTTVEVTAPQEWAPVGDTVTCEAKVVDGEGTEMSGYTFSWSSSDTTKATVNSSGVVTAVAVGEATISATATATTSSMAKSQTLARDFGAVASNSESTLKGSLKMDVVKPVARIELDPSSLSFNATGEWKTVTATLYDSDDNEMSPTYWGWGSADTEVAEVYNRIGTGVSARVQSIGEGNTTVSLSANGTKQSMDVTVTLPTARVDINPRSLTFEALGDTKSVTVKVLDENGDEDEDATWSYFGFSSPCCGPNIDWDDPSVYEIEKTDDGLDITSNGPGRGQITISSTDVESAILGVTVYMNPASVVVSPSSASLEVDGTTTLTATVEDANGNSIHVDQDDGRGGLVVYWETNDDTVATVEGSDATEDHNTGATATVTAVATGSATITGRWGSSVSGTATVTVTDNN